MSVPNVALTRALTAAQSLEAEGYFERVREGNQKAASLFARLVAFWLNPEGHENDFGCLSKSPGEQQVDGFAEDAIVYSDDPSDLENVVDLVESAGVPGAKIPSRLGVKERRAWNRWVKPQPLTEAQLKFLRPSGEPPPPPPPPAPTIKPREQFYEEFRLVNAFYKAPEGLQRQGGMVIGGECDSEAMAAWGYDLMLGKTVEQIKTAIRMIPHGEWQQKHPGEQPF